MKLDRISGIVLFIVGSIAFVTCLSYHIGTFRNPGGGLFPLIASIMLMGISALLLLQTFSAHKDEKTIVASFFHDEGAPKRILFTLACLIGYRYFLPVIGFAPSSGVMILLLSRFLGKYSWKVSVFFSVLTALLSYYIFQVALNIQMPIPMISHYYSR